MKSETTMSLLAAIEAIKAVEAALEVDAGFDKALLQEALGALQWGDRIVIEEGADQ